MPTRQQIADAAVAAIDATMPDYVSVTDHDSVPAERPDNFIVVSLARRSGGTARAGRYVTSGWSLYVMAASRTSVNNAHNALEKARAVLENTVLSFEGSDSTPVTFDNSRPVGEDDGWFTGVDAYTFAF